MDKNPKLQLHLALDLNRATRANDSSVSLLLPLLKSHPSQIKVTLYRPPSIIASTLVPARFNEGFGTWHPKIYAVDDDVLFSGANLNSSYFTTRQDRYILIRNAPTLVDWCQSFLRAVEGISYTLALKAGIDSGRHDIIRPGYHLRWNGGKTSPFATRFKAKEALLQLSQGKEPEKIVAEPGHVTLTPLIQAGLFGVRQEEQFLKRLLSSVCGSKSIRPAVHLTTGYFNLHAPYRRALLSNHNATFDLLVASPKANGFFGSKGLSGRIPEAYTLLERSFMSAIQGAGRADEVRLLEWRKPEWTYHAKGIWVSPANDQLPTMTLFGSTNLSKRSADRDLELSFAMSIPDANKEDADVLHLRRKLSEEVKGLWQFGQAWNGAQKDGERRVRRGTGILGWLVGGML